MVERRQVIDLKKNTTTGGEHREEVFRYGATSASTIRTLKVFRPARQCWLIRGEWVSFLLLHRCGQPALTLQQVD